MRTIELALVATIILGCVFKLQHWPGTGVLIVLGGGLLALFYFPFGFRTLPAPKATDQVLWMSLAGGAALCVAMAGVLAFLQRWPYSTELLVIGQFGCAASLLLGLVLRYKRPRLDIYVEGLLIRCLVVGGLAFTLWSLFSGKPR